MRSNKAMAAPATNSEGGTPTNVLNPRVVQALDSMSILADFARGYHRGALVPASIWMHAHIVGRYLGYPPPRRWLPEFLNG